jgi:HlyD family secretion protein
VVAANADGTVLPLDSTEVKSKASGEVVAVLVQTGDVVRQGQLLVRIDPRSLRNAVTQAQADVSASRAQLETAQSQLRRSDALFQSRSISEQEYETAKLAVATANDALTRAQVALENAEIAYEDADVHAPSGGVVLAKNVEVGSVISSATSVVGGTVLLKLANVDTMQVRAYVDETDIGRIMPGQAVRITVTAYPNRPFSGRVLKVEPQAVVQQNVVTFAVLARVPNPGHLLRSGMSCEVAVAIGERRDVVAVPTAALRTRSDMTSAAAVLGLSAADLAQQLGRDTLPYDYVAFVLRGGRPQAVAVAIGLVGSGYAEVLRGVVEQDTVLLLPSASLIASQAILAERARRMSGGALPGVQRQTASSTATRARAREPSGPPR